jgi:hypothetical protein
LPAARTRRHRQSVRPPFERSSRNLAARGAARPRPRRFL